MKEKQIRIQTNNIEVRSEEDNSMILEGYAATFDSPTTLYKVGDVEYKEVIERGAFDNSDMKDTCLKYNHESSIPILARSRGGSLSLSVDDKGLFFRAKLFNTQTSKDVYTLVKEGGLDRCSFAFTVERDSYDRNTNTRHIQKVGKLFDVAVVDIPAYDSTSVQARSFFDMEIEKNAMEMEKAKKKAELLRKILLSKLN